MKSRTPLLCSALFIAGMAGGWLMPNGREAISPASLILPKTPNSFLAGESDFAGLPEPSGLPGDLVHLSTISDTSTLRTLWPTSDYTTQMALLKCWMKLDPGDCIRYLLFEPVNGSPRNANLASDMAFEWAEQDAFSFLEFCGRHSNEPGHRMLAEKFHIAVNHASAADPERLMNYWKSAPFAIRDAMHRSIFDYLFKNAPARAVEEARLAPYEWQSGIWIQAHEAPDPEVILKAFLETQSPDLHPEATRNLIGKLAEQDLPAAQTIAAGLPPGPARTEVCAKIVEHLARKDPEAAWAWMEAEAPTNKNRRTAGHFLMEKDVVKAIALDPLGNWWPKSLALDDYALDLAKKDWPAMVELAESVGPNLRDQILQGAANSFSWDEGDPLPKLEQLGGLIAGMGGKEKTLNDSFFSNLDPAQAPAIATWLNAQPEPMRQALIAPMVERLRQESPATAAAWLAGLPPGEVRTEQLLRTTAAWAGTDPSAAAAFSLTLPSGPDRDYAILNTALAWHRNAPQAARAWLDTLPDSPAKARTLTELQPPGKTP